MPEAPNFITYAYVVTAFGAAMSFLAEESTWPAALLLMCLGPLHALYLVGWRTHLRAGTYPGGGTIVTIVSVLLVASLFVLSAYDRYIRDPAPVRKAPQRGSLILLGGADSTSKTGTLADLDPRTLGFPRSSARQLSYAGAGNPYEIEDTRKDLGESARIISRQVAIARRPRHFLGHSQAGLIFDRMVAGDTALPEYAALLATPPQYVTPVNIPPPDKSGPGRAGGDLARGLSWLMEKVGLQPFDVDAPNSPTNLREVTSRGKTTPTLAVWALGDSVWLDGDWRRPGEINVIALTDHVGVTDNAEALTDVHDFYADKKVADDESSWKGIAVGVLKYGMAPWRPQ